jgi:hypothetical protein
MLNVLNARVSFGIENKQYFSCAEYLVHDTFLSTRTLTTTPRWMLYDKQQGYLIDDAAH